MEKIKVQLGIHGPLIDFINETYEVEVHKVPNRPDEISVHIRSGGNCWDPKQDCAGVHDPGEMSFQDFSELVDALVDMRRRLLLVEIYNGDGERRCSAAQLRGFDGA